MGRYPIHTLCRMEGGRGREKGEVTGMGEGEEEGKWRGKGEREVESGG